MSTTTTSPTAHASAPASRLTGLSYIGSKLASGAGGKTLRALDPVTGAEIDPVFHQATSQELDAAMKLAESAFEKLRVRPAKDRAAFLNAIATELEAVAAELSARITAETALPAARNAGEGARTCGQLRMFAKMIEEGWWVDARIDHGDPKRAPVPKPDLRRMMIPLGPVAVFSASNFPQAFAVAGGDTAAALAAGCPVVVKGHRSHPGTSEITMQAILRAAKKTDMPDGVVSLIQGSEFALSLELVKHPLTRAVGFTGSLRAGRSMMDAAAARPVPIPVYAEMSSINPLVVLPGAAKERAAKLAEGLKNSVTMGVGQFCTKPGVVLAIDDAATHEFINQLVKLMCEAPAGTMLNPHIAKSFHAGRDKVAAAPGAKRATPERAEPVKTQVAPSVFTTTVDAFLKDHALREEVFGPSTVVVLAKNVSELEHAAHDLDGQLTASLHHAAGELPHYAKLIDILQQKAGRLVFNGYPTGVEVGHAQQHGGPYPATGDSRTTSVGSAAIFRFARPVSYQDCPDEALPAELQEANPHKIPRLVDGVWKV